MIKTLYILWIMLVVKRFSCIQKEFAAKKDDREIVPKDIAEKGRKEGVIQKDKNGKWRIISYKANPPRFWSSTYDTKEDASRALAAFHSRKRGGK